MSRFGDFQDICSDTPSYTWCNLFYRQLSANSNLSSLLTGLSANSTSAPVGINPSCGIQRVGSNGSLGNIANIVVCALSMAACVGLIFLTEKRKAAVGMCCLSKEKQRWLSYSRSCWAEEHASVILSHSPFPTHHKWLSSHTRIPGAGSSYRHSCCPCCHAVLGFAGKRSCFDSSGWRWDNVFSSGNSLFTVLE